MLRVINGILAGAAIVGYVLLAPRRADRVDLACLIALLVFLAAALLSAFPRQSLDSALGALTWTAAFFLARILLADADARRWLLRVLVGLSAILTLVAAARWLPPTIEWWQLTGVTPPLDMNRSGILWGHRHDLALVVAVLYPAWWVGSRSPARTAGAIVFGVLTAIVVFVDGSRTNWLALVLAGLVAAVPPLVRRWDPDRRTLLVAGAVVLVAAVVGFVGGVIPAAMDRLLTTNTLVSRADMWGALLQVWGERPINGYGPGSFAWLLQQTDYFDANSWAPRHPDSLPFQVLPEVGLLGVVAIGIVVVALAPRIKRAHPAARFALLAMAFACIGANPTEFGFFVLVGIAWAAYAAPNETEAVVIPTAVWPRWASVAAVGVIGIAFVSTAVAAFAHEEARRQITRADYARAADQLRVAERLDPGLALYPRLRGTALFLLGDTDGALAEVRHAINLNQNDDLSWRTLAYVQSATPYPAAARDSIERAVDLHRADPTNLLLRSGLEQVLGLADAALATAGESLHAWPWLVGDGATFGQEALDVAVARAAGGDPAPQSNALNAVWVASLSDDDGLLASAIDASGLTRTLGEAYAAAVTCDASVTAYLEAASDADRRFDEYWALRIRDGSAAGDRDEAAVRAWEIMTGRTLDEGIPPLSPFNENGFFGLSTDTWGYRRPPVTWAGGVFTLPSPDEAYRSWLTDPTAFAASSDLVSLEPCR